ncbi:uncharacterized protein K452DRAFT_324536 [Aplosporella prunicola CBS 121167]|uniref:Deacetylase sirtuin-type domain-containing protein n=1 Tax=Aplosporella prunicola CBS 121167 TaxID=1176127 RepID=A0A6A6BS00_9PEZI|nr:uncharacterized protein K452DRAFT_324536 [Aplosporella prunicola CBS 121167]KAF2145597.1 hypothetical protein K452DRAFT_324536 [Aplosporella prunicola CBS 121167]
MSFVDFSDQSDLSTLGSRTPSPPPKDDVGRYPSPPLSQDPSTKGSPLPESMDPATAGDDGPPRKKRRTTKPDTRTTRHLDLTAELDENDESQKEALDLLLKVLYSSRKIVMIVGAGISVSAGIPDFRSAKGLFNTLRQQHNHISSGKDLFDASVYRDPSTTASFHDMVRSLSQQAKSAKPTLFHHLIATLADEGRLLRLYSQNVDGIETSLPPLNTQIPLPQRAPWPKTVLLHGGLDKMVCAKCNDLTDFNPDIFDGPIPPACPACVQTDQVRTQHAGKRSHGIGRLRPRMVLYNENGPDEEAIGSVTNADLRTRPDALIVVGTTLKVPGVKRIAREMANTVRDRRGGCTIWINNEPAPKVQGLEDCWDLVVKGPCDAVAEKARLRFWHDRYEFAEVTDEQVRAAKEKPSPIVAVPSPRKNRHVSKDKGILTPSASPKLKPQPDTISVVRPTTPTKNKKFAATNKRKTLVVGEPKPAPKGKASNAKAAPQKKAAPKKKATTKPVAPKPAEKITKTFTASKPAAQETKMITKLKTRAQSRSRRAEPEKEPMAPVSPQEARNNTSPPYAEPDKKDSAGTDPLDTGIGRIKIELTGPIETVKMRHSGTISPGSVPKNMERLID